MPNDPRLDNRFRADFIDAAGDLLEEWIEAHSKVRVWPAILVYIRVRAAQLRGTPLTVGDVIHCERVPVPTMRRTVNDMVAHGYLEKKRDPADLRKVFLYVPEDRLEILQEKLLPQIDQMMSIVSPL